MQAEQSILPPPPPEEVVAGAALEIDGIINVSTDSDWTLIVIVLLAVMGLVAFGYFKYGKKK